MRAADAPALRLSSARCQFAFWEDGGMRIVNYLTREAVSAPSAALELIGFFLTPGTIRDALARFDRYGPENVGHAIAELIDAQLLLEYGSPEWERDRLLQSSWASWLPDAGFHFLTKDAPYVGGDWTPEQKLKTVPDTPSPPAVKSIEGAESIALPPYPAAEQDAFFETLHARRTHRTFSSRAISLAELSRLLGATWGIQGYLQSPLFGPLPVKTSPSGGARHPVEVYLVALRVQDLAAGIYHYQARGHRLERIAEASSAQARAYCADQPYAAEAAALFIMTAVFSRTMWKYHHPRAYRVVLLDAGHLGQTFCLTATRMGLAPFSTAALKDSLIEQDLGLDGISESVLYVAGVGWPAGARAI